MGGKERKISEARIEQAVKELKKEKIKPTIAVVSKKLGVHKGSLSRWTTKKKKPLEIYGIHVMRPTTEDRIREAVNFLKGKNKKPTRRAVTERMEIKPHSLSNWSRANKVSLEELGVVMWRPVIISEESIRETVVSLKTEGIIPTRSNVAKKLKKRVNYLSKWSHRKKIPLEKLGVATKRITKTRIEKVVKSLREKREFPTRDNVAQSLNIKYRSLIEWSKRSKISLESLGIIKVKRAKISKELIERAVRELKQKRLKPTIENVAKKLDVHKGSLWTWSKKNKVSLKDLGIVFWKRISEESIKRAIKCLKTENRKPTLSNVAAKLGVKKNSLYYWSTNNKIPLKDLGIARERKILRPCKIVIRKIKKKMKPKRMEIKVKPEEKEVRREIEKSLKLEEVTDKFNRAKELFETKEPEKLKIAVPLFEETITKGEELGGKDISQEAWEYLGKIKGLIKEQFEQAEDMLRLGWPEEAIPLFELVIKLEEPFKEKIFFLSAYEGLRKAKEKLQEKEKKRKQWEMLYK